MEASTNSRVGKSRRLLRVVNMSLGNAPAPPPTRNNEDWVPRGKNNLFREFLLALCHNVAPLNSCINTMALYIAGKRLVFKDANGEEVQRAHEKWLALNAEDGEAAFRSRVAKDLSIQGDRAIEVVMSKAMPQAVYHIDAMRLRSGKKDDRGRVKNYYWCSNWERYTKFGKDYPVTAIPAFGSEGMKTAGKGILFAKDYTPGEDYYGMPWYLPALTDAEVWARIPVFNRTQLDTGFRPAFHIHVFTNSDEQDIEELDANIEEVFTGADGKTYALTTGTKEEGAPVLTKLERGDHAGELDKMADRAEMVIYKACGIPPILMGVDVPTGMSGKGLALEQSVTQFMRTQVEPRQKFLTDDALRLRADVRDHRGGIVRGRTTDAVRQCDGSRMAAPSAVAVHDGERAPVLHRHGQAHDRRQAGRGRRQAGPERRYAADRSRAKYGRTGRRKGKHLRPQGRCLT
jgi:hypothetical protein